MSRSVAKVSDVQAVAVASTRAEPSCWRQPGAPAAAVRRAQTSAERACRYFARGPGDAPLKAHVRRTRAVTLPLSVAGREPLGAISFALGAGTDESVLTFLGSVTHQLSVAVDRSRLHAEARRALANHKALLATLSHDLGGLSFALKLTSAQLLKRHRNIPEVVAVDQLAQVMSALIGDLVDHNKLAAERLRLSPSAQRLDLLALQALSAHRAVAARKRIRLQSSVEAQPLVRADKVRLFQVLTNLLSNALEFTPPGGRVVLRVAADDRFGKVAVEDNGPGIPPDALPRVFERFWQIPGREGLGSGLGLTIAHELVRAQGGILRVDSALGRGSTFTFSVPLQEIA